MTNVAPPLPPAVPSFPEELINNGTLLAEVTPKTPVAVMNPLPEFNVRADVRISYYQ